MTRDTKLHVMSVLRDRNNFSKCTTEPFPDYKEGCFSWLDRLLVRHVNYSDTYTMVYPYKWQYITVEYQILNNVAYILSIKSKPAV